MFIVYCVAPNYTLFFVVALIFSFKIKKRANQKYPLQNVDQLLAVQVCHNSKKSPCCSYAGPF